MNTKPSPDASPADLLRALEVLAKMVEGEWPASTVTEAVECWGHLGRDDEAADVRAVAAVFGDPVPEWANRRSGRR